MLNLTLTIETRAAYLTVPQWNTGGKPEDGQVIEPGELVEYVAHLAGGMVKVRHKEHVVIIRPACTRELL